LILLNDIEEISLPWLNEVFDTDSITAFTSKRIGEGVGWLGILSIVTLESEDDSIPNSAVVKIQTTEEANLASVEAFDLYGREVAFYQNLSRHCSITTPVCYASFINQQRNQFTLVLQDFSDLQMLDQLEGANEQECLLIVQSLARMHGLFWGRTDEPQFAWMYEFNDQAKVIFEIIGALLDESFRKYQGNVPPVIKQFLQTFTSRMQSLAPRLYQQKSFIHGDFRLDNIFLDKGAAEVRVIDWQICAKGPPLYDLATFLSASVSIEVRRAIERDAVRHYHDTLLAAGVTNYSFDRCWRDYVWAVPFSFCDPILTLSTIDAGNERGDKLVQAIFERGITAMADHETHKSGLV